MAGLASLAALLRDSAGMTTARAPEYDAPGLGVHLTRACQAEIRRGILVLSLALGLGGPCAALIPIKGAITVTGTLVSGSNSKKIQHPSGGVVAQILVHDGDHVERGDVVARLDEVAARASLEIVEKQLDESEARVARLLSESQGLDRLLPTPELSARMRNRDISQLLASEQAQLQARVGTRSRQFEILQQRVAQLEEESSGLRAQTESKDTQRKYVAKELQGLEELYQKNLVPLTRLSAIAREAAQLDGDRTKLRASLAENQSKIEEAKLQISAAKETYVAEITKELGEAQSKLSELRERQIAVKTLVDRIEIRAPQSGVVYQSAVNTEGGVVGAGEVLMMIVPDGDRLIFEGHVQPKDIDQIQKGQRSFIRFSAFDRATTPEFKGSVTYVSPDISRDPQTGSQFYTVKVAFSQLGAGPAKVTRLLPGMPAEAFLETGSRSLISYLLKPLTDQLKRTFRER